MASMTTPWIIMVNMVILMAAVPINSNTLGHGFLRRTRVGSEIMPSGSTPPLVAA